MNGKKQYVPLNLLETLNAHEEMQNNSQKGENTEN